MPIRRTACYRRVRRRYNRSLVFALGYSAWDAGPRGTRRRDTRLAFFPDHASARSRIQSTDPNLADWTLNIVRDDDDCLCGFHLPRDHFKRCGLNRVWRRWYLRARGSLWQVSESTMQEPANAQSFLFLIPFYDRWSRLRSNRCFFAILLSFPRFQKNYLKLLSFLI